MKYIYALIKIVFLMLFCNDQIAKCYYRKISVNYFNIVYFNIEILNKKYFLLELSCN